MANKQIHELSALSGTPATTDVLAIDTGSVTAKVSVSALKGAITADVVADVTALSAAAVQVTEQSFTDAQKTQARANIGAAADADAVKVTEQSFTDAQKTQARTNIGAASDADAVKVTEQSFTDAQKAQARANIGAAADADAVKVTEQSLTDAQKTQARTNIGAVSEEMLKSICPAVTVGPSAMVPVTDAMPFDAEGLTVAIDDANGVSSVTVTRTGKNVLQLPATNSDGMLTFTRESDGTLSISGTQSASGTASKNITYYFNRYSTGRSLYGDYIVTMVGTAYTGEGWLYITKANSTTRYVGGVTGANISVRCAEGIGNMYLYIPKNSVISESHLQVMVRPATITDDTFEAYNGQSATIALGRTVTEGTLDVIGGKLTVSDTTYDVTAEQITMLDGANAVWANTGNTTLTYRANPYAKLLALIESYHPAQQLSVQTLNAPTPTTDEPGEDESR